MNLTLENISRLIIDLLDFKLVIKGKDYIKLVKYSQNGFCYTTIANKYMHIYISDSSDKITMVFKMDIDNSDGANNFCFFDKGTTEWSYLIHTILSNINRFEEINENEFKRDANIHLLLED